MARRPGPEIRQGEIYWARVVPPRGEPKRRPVGVLTHTERVLLDEPIACVAITSAPIDSDDPNLVALPWNAQGRVGTGLRRPSWAVPNWLLALRPSDLLEYIGRIPRDKVDAIVRLAADPEEET